MSLYLYPRQGDAVLRAVEKWLASREAPGPDPWWRAGLEEALAEAVQDASCKVFDPWSG